MCIKDGRFLYYMTVFFLVLEANFVVVTSANVVHCSFKKDSNLKNYNVIFLLNLCLLKDCPLCFLFVSLFHLFYSIFKGLACFPIIDFYRDIQKFKIFIRPSFFRVPEVFVCGSFRRWRLTLILSPFFPNVFYMRMKKLLEEFFKHLFQCDKPSTIK